MRGPEKQAIVVRNQEGELEVKEQKLKLIKDRYPILGVPFIRGVVNFLASLVEGVKALMWSAEFYPDDQEETPSKFEQWLEKRFGSAVSFAEPTLSGDNAVGVAVLAAKKHKERELRV